MSTPCCHLCRSSTGICLTRFQCDHHKEAEAQEDADARARRTYNNPTADRAIANIMASTRNPKRPRR